MTVTNLLHEVIIGSILGDLTAEKPSLKHNTRLQFKQSTKNTLYIEHLYELFKDYCSSPPIVLSKFDNRPSKLKEYSAIKFQTLSLPCFNIYKDIFYNDKGVKIIPNNTEELLTARSLAYLLMDDGYKSLKGFYISSESYTLEENQKLAEALNSKFNLYSSVHAHTNGHRLYIQSKSMDLLISLVKPYFLNHFYYKLDNKCND